MGILTRDWTQNPGRPVRVKSRYNPISGLFPAGYGIQLDAVIDLPFTVTGTVTQSGARAQFNGSSKLVVDLPPNVSATVPLMTVSVVYFNTVGTQFVAAFSRVTNNPRVSVLTSTGKIGLTTANSFGTAKTSITTNATAAVQERVVSVSCVRASDWAPFGGATYSKQYALQKAPLQAANNGTGNMNLLSRMTYGQQAASGTAALNGDIEMCYYLNYEPTPDELYALTQNPWAIFQPDGPPLRTYSFAGASAPNVGASAGTGAASGVGVTAVIGAGASTGAATAAAGSIVLAVASGVSAGTGAAAAANASLSTASGASVGAATVVAASVALLIGAGVAAGVGAASAASALQQLLAASDITSGTWVPSTGSSLYGPISESVASTAEFDSTPSPSVMEVKFSAGADPGVDIGHAVSYEIQGPGNLQVDLVEGSRVVATWTHSPAPSSYTTFTQVLTTAQAGSILDYTDLRLRFTSS